MHTLIQRASLTTLLISIFFGFSTILAQSAGNSGTIYGTVADPTGAVISGAAVSIVNPVSGLSRHTTTDGMGRYQFTNLPLNPYHLTISAASFSSVSQDADMRSTVPITLNVTLKPGATSTTVEVTTTGQDLIENDPVGHTDVDRDLFQKLPLESSSSALSSLVTLASPGIAADSNGLFHGLGDHASNSFSIDSQPVTDQQSKVFSNQLPTNSVQSLEVIDGAPPAEFGGKTSVVIVVTTRSGQGVTTPTGSVTTSYGTFGSATASADLSYGGKNWGNFIELDGLNTGRFLDPPEFAVFHDKGNEFNVFDRIDRQLTAADSVHFNLGVNRSWFQTPNSYDNLNIQNVISGGTSASPVFGSVGNTDQRSKIDTFNIAPTYTHTISVNSVFNFTGYVRRDSYNYYPSGNPLADLGPPSLQNQTIGQTRSLTDSGAHTNFTYAKGVNNIKVGAEYSQTFLRELDPLAIVSSTFNSPCVDANGNSLPGFTGTNPNECAKAGEVSNYPVAGGNFNPVLLRYDLTRGGGYYTFNGHTDIKELGLYAEDQITAGDWTINAGLRGDLYNGLAIQRQPEPRFGVSYNIKQTNTILRTSYARTLESPFNENLVLSSQGCGNDVLAPLLACNPGAGTTLQPGFRNEFHAGLQQAFGKNFVLSGDYIWKYTHNAFDFSVLGNTPITFPIDWHNSKIPGFDLRADVPHFHGLSAFVVMSSVAARFYGPQVAGAGANGGVAVGYPFRIDHDEKYNQTTHLQYQIPGKFSPWFSFNWRFDSGLVAGSTPCYNPGSNDPNTSCPNSSLAPNGNPATLNGQPAVVLVDNNIPAGVNPVTGGLAYLPLSADQELQAGFSCNGVKATGHNLLGVNIPGTPFYECEAAQFSSSLIAIPATGTGSNDHNPPRIAHRDVFDASVGQDNLFNGDKYKWSLHLTAVNLTNKYALYNYLSTFSGTHYLTPRALTAELGFHF
jgi:hypothetical protein